MDDILNLIKTVGENERRMTEMEFVSPIYRTDTVVMRVRGLIHRLKIRKTDPGWYVLQPVDTRKAKIIGDADMMQVEQYLKYLKKMRIVLIQKNGDQFLGVPLKNTGLDFSKPLPVLLTNDMVGEFDTVICGFDGATMWFADIDMQSDPAKVEYLRESISNGVAPDKIRYTGLSIEEKAAYMLRFTLDKTLRETLKERRLREDVEFAGGKFIKFDEKKDHFSITYEVDGHKYNSYISKDPAHHVLTAGICLEGGDSDFDLKSLIGVLREGQNRGLIHRFHNTDE